MVSNSTHVAKAGDWLRSCAADRTPQWLRGADACYIGVMGTAAESVKLDDDVHEELAQTGETLRPSTWRAGKRCLA